MGAEKKTDTSRQAPTTKAPDTLIEAAKKGDTELSEKELAQVAGGRLDPYKS